MYKMVILIWHFGETNVSIFIRAGYGNLYALSIFQVCHLQLLTFLALSKRPLLDYLSVCALRVRVRVLN